jgi:hypothetical protein
MKMKKKVPILISSMRNSPRLPILIRRLKKFNLKYKVFYGLNENEKNKKIIYKFYNQKLSKKRMGREMGFHEIGTNYTQMRMFKYAQKKKYNNVILMADDVYPSQMFKEWIDKRVYFTGNKNIGFQCVPTGVLYNKYSTVLNKRIKIYKAKTHLFNSNCNQHTIGYIKKFIKITKGKSIGNGDFPFNLKKNNLELLQTVPFLTYHDDESFSYINKDRERFEKPYFKKFRNFIYKKFSTKNINLILNFFRYFYYLLFIPIFLRKYKNLEYYIEYYFEKFFYKFVSIFTKRYIDIENIYSLKSTYPPDLKKYCKPKVFNIK